MCLELRVIAKLYRQLALEKTMKLLNEKKMVEIELILRQLVAWMMSEL